MATLSFRRLGDELDYHVPTYGTCACGYPPSIGQPYRLASEWALFRADYAVVNVLIAAWSGLHSSPTLVGNAALTPCPLRSLPLNQDDDSATRRRSRADRTERRQLFDNKWPQSSGHGRRSGYRAGKAGRAKPHLDDPALHVMAVWDDAHHAPLVIICEVDGH